MDEWLPWIVAGAAVVVIVVMAKQHQQTTIALPVGTHGQLVNVPIGGNPCPPGQTMGGPGIIGQCGVWN